MKFILTGITAIIIAHSSLAQNTTYNVKQTNLITEMPGGHLHQFNDGNFAFVYHNYDKGKSITFQLYDSELKLKKTNKPVLESNLDSKKTNTNGFIALKNKAFVILKETIDSENKSNYYSHEISLPDIKNMGAPKKLYSINSKYILDNFDAFYSNDKSKACIVKELRADKYEVLDKRTYHVATFDESLNVIYEGEYSLPYKMAQVHDEYDPIIVITYDNFKLSNNGNLYGMTSVREKGKEAGEEIYRLDVFYINKTNKVVETNTIDLAPHIPRDARFDEDEKGNMYVVGSYCNPETMVSLGTFMVKFDDKSGKLSEVNKKLNPLQLDMFTGSLTNKQLKQYKNGELKEFFFGNVKINHIHILENGTITVIAEIYNRPKWRYATAQTSSSGNIEVYAEDLLIYNMSADGKINWFKTFPKRQKAFNLEADGLSTASFKKGNHAHVFFIDNPDNINLPEGETPKTYMNRKNGNLIGLDINEKGEIIKNNLGEVESFNPNFHVRKFKKGSKQNLYVNFPNKKKPQLFVIDTK